MPVQVAPGIRLGTNCFYGRDGYSYHINKKRVSGGRASLRCSHYVALQCHGRASCTQRGKYFRQTQPHNHPSEPHTREVRLLRAAVLSRCREDGSTDLKEIYDQERRRLEVSPEAAAWMTYNDIRCSMLRARSELLPNVPHTLPELENVLTDDLYEHLTNTLDGKGSVYAGTFGREEDGTCCTIFASRRQLRYLSKRKCVFSDATFDSVPAAMECRQVWNIITVRRGRIIPVARILMQTKKKECYITALEALKGLVPGFNPRKVNCDFEPAQYRAWKTCFPGIRIRGCLFHYSKNVIKRARKLGLQTVIQQDGEVQRLVRMVCAVPLLPTKLLVKGLTCIGKRAIRTGKFLILEEFLKKIDKTWLKPSVKPVLSVYKAKHRTSNACESDNAAFARRVRAPHPNTWRFLGGVVESEDLFVQDVACFKHGGTPSRQRRCSTKMNDKRIKAFQEDLQEKNISVATFLRRASRRLQGSFNNLLGIPNV